MSIEKLQPTCVWEKFDAICKIPRPSKHEEKITQYLIDFAKQRKLECKQDAVGNVFISKPATVGFEGKETIVLQGHVDMVPQKEPNIEHNFLTDSIDAYIDNDVVTANGTTLGADNGIGVSLILAVLDANNIEHGPIQALFTIDEETGMTGAFALKNTDITAKYLINLDTENENEITIGGAGGLDANFSFNLNFENINENNKVYTVSISGLTGGHSGFEIVLERANANKLLCEFLSSVSRRINLRLISFNGGNMRNAIPREASAVITFDKDFELEFHQMFKKFISEKKEQYSNTDANLQGISAETITNCRAITEEQTLAILRAITYCPNGVISYENNNCNLIRTSTNLSFVKTSNNKLEIGCLLRSIDYKEKQDLAETLKSIFTIFGAETEFTGDYPGWQPVWTSELLTIAKKSCKKIFKTEPNVAVVHAGLECGIFADTFPKLEAISFGPTIKGPHSPNEYVEIESVGKIWEVLKLILKDIPNK